MHRRIHTHCLSVVVGILLLVPLHSIVLAQSEIDTESARIAEQGESIFLQRCSACHTVGGGDKPMGPDLAGVTEKRDRAWLERIIQEPGKLIAEGDTAALELKEKYGMVMPAMKLSPEQLEAVLTFLGAPGEKDHHLAEVTAKVPVKQLARGEPERGKALYVGTAAFKNGGAPCLACHGVAAEGLGLAAGASYNIDLTDFFENYGAEGVVSMLETLPFPSMEPIYNERPLTEDEQQDLAAFFEAISGQEPARVQGAFVLQAGGVFMALAIIAFFYGQKRLRKVRVSLVEKTHLQKKGEMR